MSEKTVFNSVPDLKYTEAAEATNPEEFEKVVRSRRSVRVYTDEAIPEQITNKCIDLALLAPNSSNLQMVEYHWVRSADKKKTLARYCMGQSAATSAQELIVCVARTATWKQHCKEMMKLMRAENKEVPAIVSNYYEKLAPFVYNQGPFGIMGLVKRLLLPLIGISKVVPRGPKSQSDMKLWAAKSAALGCENLMLAFRAYGYDTCPMEGFDDCRVTKLLNLPSDAFPVMVVSAGKRADNGVYGPQVRFPRDWFVKEI